MDKVIWHVTMSLDGFIAGPRGEMEWAFGYHGANAVADDVMRTTGAILAGRGWYDAATARYDGRAGIYGGAWEGPVLVLTHRPPEGQQDPGITFLSEGIDAAVARARAAAGGGRNLEVFGADVARRCLERGLLDEIVVHLAPILLGAGVRLPDGSPVRLERTALADSGELTTLRFSVRRPQVA
jgi:dihydrofolate reductase